LLPSLKQVVLDAELVEHFADGLREKVIDRLGPVIEGRHRREHVAPANVTVSVLRMWMRLSGVSRGTKTRRRRSFKHTSAARDSRFALVPVAISASDFIEQGTTTMPIVRKEPDETAAPRSLGS
jgi:hypothetical protein